MKKNLLYLLLLIISAYIECYSQTPSQVTWINKSKNDIPLGGATEGEFVSVDGLGNKYVVGYFEKTADFDPSNATYNLASVGKRDIYIAKYSPTNQLLWAKSIGNQSIDNIKTVAVDEENGIVIAGYSENSDIFNGIVQTDTESFGTNNIVRYDSNGIISWKKRIGTNIISISSTSNGELIIAGNFNQVFEFQSPETNFTLPEKGQGDIFITKLQLNGTHLWTKTTGSTNLEYIKSMTIDINNNIYLVGELRVAGCLDPNSQNILTTSGTQDSFIAKYDSNCNYLWAKRYDTTDYESINSVNINNSGEINIMGYFYGSMDFDFSDNNYTISPANGNIFFAKYSNNGDFIWAKIYGASQTTETIALETDSLNNIYIAGKFKGSMDFDPSDTTYILNSPYSNSFYISKYNSNGELVFAKASIGNGAIQDIASLAVDTNNRLYITGYFFGSTDLDFSDTTATETAGDSTMNSFLSCYTENCDYINSLKIGGYSSLNFLKEQGTSVATDSNNNVYVVGTYQSNITFSSSNNNILNLNTNGNKDSFIAKYDQTGNLLWVKSIGGSNNDEIISIKIGNNGKIYLVGTFMGVVDFDPSATTANLSGNFSESIFIGSYDLDGNYIWAKKIDTGGLIYTTDIKRSIFLDNSNNLYLTGNYKGDINFNLTSNNVIFSSNNNTIDAFMAKYDADGNFIWAKSIGGNGDLSVKGIAEKGNKIYLTGHYQGQLIVDSSNSFSYYNSSNQSFDIFLAAFDSNGNYLWSKSFGGVGGDTSSSIAIDSKNNVLLAGTFFRVADFDPSNGIANLFSGRNSNTFIAKYDTNGNYVWAKSFNCASSDVTAKTSITLDINDYLYLTGQLEGYTDFDPSAQQAYMNSYGSSFGNIFLAKYDPNGKYIWVKGIDYGNSEATSITLDTDNQILVTGYYEDMVAFNPNNPAHNSTSSNSNDLFVAKFSNLINYEISLTPSTTNVCPGEEKMLSVYASNTISADQWRWYANTCEGLYLGSGYSIVVMPTTTTTYYVKLINGTTTECVSKTITVNDTTPPLPPNLDKIISECGVTPPTPVAYDNCSGMIAGTTDTQFPITTEGQNVVTWRFRDNNGNQSTSTQIIEINRVTQVSIESTENSLIANPTATSYQWIDCENGNNPINGATNKTFIPSQNGNYTVIINVNGCEFVSECKEFFNPNFDDISDVKYYPNPVSDILKIQFKTKISELSIDLYNILGDIIKKYNFQNQKDLELPIHTLTNGIYFLKINNGENVKTLKVIKK